MDGNDVAVAAGGKACDVKIAKDMAGTRKIRRESERYGGMKDYERYGGKSPHKRYGGMEGSSRNILCSMNSYERAPISTTLELVRFFHWHFHTYSYIHSSTCFHPSNFFHRGVDRPSTDDRR